MGGGDGFDDMFAININGQWNFIDTPLALYGEFNYATWENDGTPAAEDDRNLWWMVGMSYGLRQDLIVSVMVDWVNPSKNIIEDGELEVAGAVLTNPTADANFSVNFEVAYIESAVE